MSLDDTILANQQAAIRNLVTIRKLRGMTQTDVADAMGIAQSAISGIERADANITLKTLRRYALAVGAEVKIQVSQPLEIDLSTY